jgi:hypothetical protein
MVQITRIGVKQTAKVIAIFYFLISIAFVLPIALIAIFAGSIGGKEAGNFPAVFGGFFMVVIPFLYATLGFVMVAVSATIYNLIAKRAGGVEFELNNETLIEKVENSSKVKR